MPRWTPEQLSAIKESGQNIIVSAGAGSGKTAVLTQRVLEKIESGIHINELLILTFTNAAAFEMKERIRKKLLSDEKYYNELKLLNSSYIATFDSYALSIVKKYHYLLNLPSNISISDESIIKIKEKDIIDDIFDELYKTHDEDFEFLINTYSTKNDKEVRNNILKLCVSLSNKINYREYIDNLNNYFFSEDNIIKIYNDYLKLLKNKRNELSLLLNDFSYYVDSNIIDKFNQALNGILTCEIKDVYLYSSTSLPRISKYPSDEAREYKELIKKNLDGLIDLSKYGNFDSVKNILLDSKRNTLTISRILDKYMSILNKYKSENNIYNFNDIEFFAIKILKENESIRNEVSSSFKEIMIDEYQDTNDVQDTFIKLIENNNVYMVGDIKQSIYKFRGSNPNIFKIKYDNYSDNNGGLKIDLINNFRSRFEVLQSINNIFELLMDNNLGDAKYKLSHKMVYGLDIYDEEKMDDFDYSTSILEYNTDSKYSNTEIEIFTIASDIKNKIDSELEVFDKDSNKLRRVKYSDFVIILDRSRYFDDYKKVFEYMGIPLTILKDNNLTNNTDMLLIRNLIELVIKINKKEYDINFKYDFVSVARSFLYEYSDEYIYDIVSNNKYFDSSIFKDLSNIKNINSSSISDIFYNVLCCTDYYNKLNKVGDITTTNMRLRTIYNISSNLNNSGYDIYDFIDYLNNINENGIDIKYKSSFDGSDSVKIMTIHGSKGLEYPFCYFADLDHKFNDNELKDKFILSDNYGIIVNEEDTNILKDLYKYDFKVSEISERMRLFYVALTRAREKITIVLPYSDTKKYPLNDDGVIDEIYRTKINKLSDYIYYIKDYLNSYFTLIDNNSINLSKDYLYTKNKNNQDLLSDNVLNVQEITIENNINIKGHYSKEKNSIIDTQEFNKLRYGTSIHKILEFIDFKNYDSSIIKDNYIRTKIDSFINNKLFSNIKDANIYKEYEFKYKKDNKIYNGVIDLMIEYSNYIDIIDYKLKNIDDDKYIDQLKGYKEYISLISNKNVNIYLYSIIDEKVKKLE